MLNVQGRQFLAVLLCLWIANAPNISAASAAATPRTAIGSIQSHGAVRVGEILAASDSTLFAGDRVQTNNGGASVQYREGVRITLGSESVATFTPERVQIERGLMTFQTIANNRVSFAASSLRLEPSSAKTVGNVVFKDSRASVSVSEGTVKVLDPSGVQLAALNAGDARVFEEAAAEPPSAAAPAAAPQGGSSGSSHKWALIGIGAGVVGASLGIAGLVRANDANDQADQSTSALAAAQAQLAAAQTQANALAARIAALGTASANAAAIQADLALQIARLTQAQAALNTIVSQLAAGQITPAQAQQQLTALQATLTQIVNAITSDQAKLAQCINTLSSSNPSCPA